MSPSVQTRGATLKHLASNLATHYMGVLEGTTNSISSISGFACNGAEPSLSACPVVTGASVPCSLATSGQLRDVAKAGNCTHLRHQTDDVPNQWTIEVVHQYWLGNNVQWTGHLKRSGVQATLNPTSECTAIATGQDTNGSLVPVSTSTGTVSKLFFLQCSIVLTTCNHSHDAGV
ncbi:hypothetical protein EMCRGX_G030380 [Ephydatia muelleri]